MSFHSPQPRFNLTVCPIFRPLLTTNWKLSTTRTLPRLHTNKEHLLLLISRIISESTLIKRTSTLPTRCLSPVPTHNLNCLPTPAPLSTSSMSQASLTTTTLSSPTRKKEELPSPVSRSLLPSTLATPSEATTLGWWCLLLPITSSAIQPPAQRIGPLLTQPDLPLTDSQRLHENTWRMLIDFYKILEMLIARMRKERVHKSPLAREETTTTREMNKSSDLRASWRESTTTSKSSTVATSRTPRKSQN